MAAALYARRIADSSGLDYRRDALGRVLGEFRQFEVTLSGTARFAGLLYLRPEPEEPFVALTEALVEAFPAFLPYGGEFEETVPHATVAEGDEELLAGLAQDLTARLPVKARVERVWVVENAPSGWRRHTAFPLERRKSV